MTFDKYVVLCTNKDIDMREHRGEMWYNILREDRRALACAIAGSEADPYYNDARVGVFLQVVLKFWDKEDVTYIDVDQYLEELK